MYNEKQKMQYIIERTAPGIIRDNAVSLFELLAPYESKRSSDFASRNAKLFQDLIELYPSQDKVSSSLRYSILLDYLNWADKESGHEDIDNEIRQDIYGLQRTRNSMVESPDDLKILLDKIYGDDSTPRTESLYKCACWLAFIGVNENDITSVKTGEIDFENLMIHYKGRELPLYMEAIKVFRTVAFADTFQFYKYPTSKYPTFSSRIESDYLLRGIKRVPELNTIRSDLSKRCTKLINDGVMNRRVLLYNLYLSGIFYRVYLEERRTSEVNFTEFFSEKFRLDENKQKISAKASDLKRRYAIWKLAFYGQQ